jgi:SAM-dependent methyltransferase
MPVLPSWLAALEPRHLANLTRSELTRALRALSSCYVERREKLAGGAALDGAGKRAAFALFYGPLHFFTIKAIVRAIDAKAPKTIHDLGCGTGVGGAAWAIQCNGTPAISGIDRNAWTVTEANRTYKELGLRGRAQTGDLLTRFPALSIPRLPDSPITQSTDAVLLAYAVNELPDAQRDALLPKVREALSRGAQLLIVEPIAKRDRPWWPAWAAALTAAGAREDEWRFPADLPPPVRQIAKSAGLDPRELTARTLSRAG